MFSTFAPVIKKQCYKARSRSGAVVARWAHNPKVVCSNQASATKEEDSIESSFFMSFSLQSFDLLG